MEIISRNSLPYCLYMNILSDAEMPTQSPYYHENINNHMMCLSKDMLFLL